MRLGVLTSQSLRHRYFARCCVDELPVVAIGHEDTGYSPADLSAFDLSSQEAEVVNRHFEERDRQEEFFFGEQSKFISNCGGIAVTSIEPGTLNTQRTCSFLKEAGVDTLAVFGTNLIKEPLLSRWGGRIVNIHLGLSPYYRGTGTNFYPLLNDEPEYIGATIHMIDQGIDSGPILRHVRPEIVAEDGPHTIGCRAIRDGVCVLVECIKAFALGQVAAVPQWSAPGARLYLRKDYHPRQVVRLYEMLNEGLIPRYVQRAAKVRGGFRLIEKLDPQAIELMS